MEASSRWSAFGSRVRSGLAGVGLLTVGAVALQVAAARRRSGAALPSDGFILELDLEQNSLVEHAKPNPLAALMGQGGHGVLQLSKVTEALRAAGDDARVHGLLALIGSTQGGAGVTGLAQMQELRDAVAEFRQRAGARAPTLAYADAFGEAGAGGTGGYYLASAFEFIAIQPTGAVSATGLATTSAFARGFLERWKVRPIFFAREEYKSAASFILNKSSTKPEREALRSILDSLSGQLVGGIAAARGLSPKQVQAAIDAAPHLPADAERLGLIDARLYRDQALKMVVRLHESMTAGAAAAKPAAHAAAAAGAADSTAADPSRAAIAEAAAGGSAGAAGAGAGAVAAGVSKPALLQQLLAEPDAEPARLLKHVSVRRYIAALDQQKKEQEAAERQEAALARLRSWVDRTLEVAGWPLVLEAMRGGGGSTGGSGSGAEAAVGGDSASGGETTQHSAAGAGEASAAGAATGAKGQEQGAPGASGSAPGPAHVALLTLTGPIYLGMGPTSPIPSGPAAARNPSTKIASLPVIKSLREARKDPAVKAVVLRIDSPGGSAAGSDAIHREVGLLRAAGKPVVVSMGNVAASGGYFISAAASKIVAQPGTITGSIGVLAGKLVLDEALREYGISTETIKAGRNADAMSPLTGFDKQQRRKVEAMIDDIYAHFKQIVAEGRGLSAEAVSRLAKGRVWTGEQALQLGLVDQLGGLEAAVALAKREAGLPEEEQGPQAVLVKEVYPKHKSALAQVLKAMGGGDSSGGSGDGSGGGQGAAAAAAAGSAAAALAAAVAGRQLTAAEWALLAQGGALGPLCLALDAERLAAVL